MRGTFATQQECVNQANVAMSMTGQIAHCQAMQAGAVPNPSNDGGWNLYQQCHLSGAC
jgi:hypothetical protein